MSGPRLQKHERAALEAVKAMHPDFAVTMETTRKSHLCMLVVYRGIRVDVRIASSPSSGDKEVATFTKQLVRRAFAAKGIDLKAAAA